MMPRIRRAGSLLAAAIVLAGCGHSESLTTANVPTLPPPTPGLT